MSSRFKKARPERPKRNKRPEINIVLSIESAEICRNNGWDTLEEIAKNNIPFSLRY